MASQLAVWRYLDDVYLEPMEKKGKSIVSIQGDSTRNEFFVGYNLKNIY